MPTDIEQEVLDPERAAQRKRNQAARFLLRKWMADESGYDERVWPLVKQLIEENSMSDRKWFRATCAIDPAPKSPGIEIAAM